MTNKTYTTHPEEKNQARNFMNDMVVRYSNMHIQTEVTSLI